MPLFDRLKEIGISNDEICTTNVKTLQLNLAGTLRNAAINHLQNGNGTVARGFREAYQSVAGVGDRNGIGRENTQAGFLNKQRKAGVFGTYIEAAALGELLECNVVVTPIKNKLEQPRFCIYKAAKLNNQEAPTVHLYCVENNHWYAIKNKPKQTIPDGNCLYNGFAQELQSLAIRNVVQRDDKPISSRLRHRSQAQGIFSANNQEAIDHQLNQELAQDRGARSMLGKRL